MVTRPAVVPTLLRTRRGLCVVVGAAAALTASRTPADLQAFARWGDELLHGHLHAVYVDPANQGGPFQLLVNLVVRLVAPSGTVWLPVVALVNGGLVYAAMRSCAAWNRDAATEAQLARRELLVAAVVILWLNQGSLWSGHSAEALIPALWFAGMMCARRGRAAAAGALFGASMGVAPWAILAVPAVLAVTRLRTALVVAAVAGVVGPALYLPFVLTGRFNLLQYRWQVQSHSLVSVLMPVGAPFGWPQRLLQAAVVIGVTVAVAVWLRDHPPLALVLAPMVTCACRVATDPKRLDYYSLPMEVLTVLAVLLAPMTRERLGIRRRTLALCYVAWACVAAGQPDVGALLVIVLIGAHTRRPSLTASGPVRAGSAVSCTAAPTGAASELGRCP